MENTLIYRLNKLHHHILSHFAERDSKGYPDFRTEVMKRFGFENKFGWNIMLNAIYLIEDTEYAKIAFLKFGLQGPSRYDEVGERYLRLYGILNAIYQQYLALANLLELYKISNKKKIIDELRKTRVLELRNKIGSHSANYSNNLKNSEIKIDVYEVSREHLSYEEILILKNQEEFDKYDLTLDINKYDSIISKNLFIIVEKAIKKAFNNKSKFKEELDLLNEELKGNIVIKNKDNTIIVKKDF